MCICNIFSLLGLFLGELLYAVQKIIQCLAVGSVFTCLMVSFTVFLMLGIGLGYNHCYIEGKKEKSIRSKPSWWRKYALNESDADETDIDTSDEDVPVTRSQNTSMPATIHFNTTTEEPISPTMIIPLHSKNNILRLIRRIRKQGRNITLEIIAK